jgi:hypothetical protein
MLLYGGMHLHANTRVVVFLNENDPQRRGTQPHLATASSGVGLHTLLRTPSCSPGVCMSWGHGRTILGRARHPAARAAPRLLCDHGPAAFWLHWVHGTPGVVAA